MKRIDKTNWSRAEIFEFFSSLSYPFYSVTFRVDVTNLHAYVRKNHLSFYYSLGWLAAKALNAIENFRYIVRDGEVCLLEERVPSLTDLKPGSDAFYFVNVPFCEPMELFCGKAKEQSLHQTTLFQTNGIENDTLIYMSCIPWLELTGATNPRAFDRDDNIPRLTWGKYSTDPAGRETLGMSVEVNHRFIDGYHIGKFCQMLQQSIDALEI